MSILSDIEGKEMTGLFERISELDVEAIELIKKCMEETFPSSYREYKQWEPRTGICA